MESIYVCAGTIVCSLMLCTLLRLISPQTNFSKILSVIIGVFALLCIISPLKEITSVLNDKSTSAVLEDYSNDIEIKYDSEVLSLTGEYINKYLYSLISAENIQVKNISTSVAHSENKGIYLREVCIYLTEEQTRHSDNIKEIIISAVCIEPKITVVKSEEQ